MRGSVTFDGEAWQTDAARVPTHRRGIGYVFQDGRLFPHLSVEQNLRFALSRSMGRRSIDFGAAVDGSRSRRSPRASHADALGRRAAARRDRARAADEPTPDADGRAAVLARRRTQARDLAPHRKAAAAVRRSGSVRHSQRRRSRTTRERRRAARRRQNRRPRPGRRDLRAQRPRRVHGRPRSRSRITLTGHRIRQRHRDVADRHAAIARANGRRAGRDHPPDPHPCARRRDRDRSPREAQHPQRAGRADPGDRDRTPT